MSKLGVGDLLDLLQSLLLFEKHKTKLGLQNNMTHTIHSSA